MILPEQLGHRFGFVMMTPGKISAADNDDGTVHELSILKLWADEEEIFVLLERAHYIFKKSKNGEDYILSRVCLVKTGKIEGANLWLPGAEVYNWEGDEKDD